MQMLQLWSNEQLVYAESIYDLRPQEKHPLDDSSIEKTF